MRIRQERARQDKVYMQDCTEKGEGERLLLFLFFSFFIFSIYRSLPPSLMLLLSLTLTQQRERERERPVRELLIIWLLQPASMQACSHRHDHPADCGPANH